MAQHSLDNLYANQAGQNFATLAGGIIQVAPGAGQRIRILSVQILGIATGAAGTTYAALQYSAGGFASPWIKFGLNGAISAQINMAMQCNILCDENTGLTAKCGGADVTNGGYAVCVQYRIEKGTGTS
jgi:hypothetical protein